MTEIAKEYGTALFMLASEEGVQREYAGHLDKIKKLFILNPLYADMLSSPAIPLKERLSAVDGAFGGRVPAHINSYLKLLCEKGRIGCFVQSVEEYKALLNASERVFKANVTSAVALTEEEKDKLIAKLGQIYKGKVEGVYGVDPALLGGLIVEVDGVIMDGSLRRRLQEIKEVIK